MKDMVIAMLRNGEMSGQDMREQLNDAGHKLSAPQFYLRMSELEEAGLIVGFYRTETIDGQEIKRRCYRSKP